MEFGGRQGPVRTAAVQGSIIVTSNKSYVEWGAVFGDEVAAAAILDRLLHYSTTVNIRGESYGSMARLEAQAKAIGGAWHAWRTSWGAARTGQAGWHGSVILPTAALVQPNA